MSSLDRSRDAANVFDPLTHRKLELAPKRHRLAVGAARAGDTSGQPHFMRSRLAGIRSDVSIKKPVSRNVLVLCKPPMIKPRLAVFARANKILRQLFFCETSLVRDQKHAGVHVRRGVGASRGWPLVDRRR
jgi:hypothetical protein